MNTHRLIIDASSILRACHYAGKDVEFGYTVTFQDKQVFVNSAYWAYENFMTSYRSVLDRLNLKPNQTILVLDGKDSRAVRRNIWAGYKAHRPPSAPELNKEYYEALDGIADEITALGGLSVYQDLMEADDVIAHLAQRLLGKKTIWSRDGDMLALRNENVDILLKDDLNPAHYESCPDARWVRLYKATVGDSSDGFLGARGFGKGAFQKFALAHGVEGLADLESMVINRELHEIDTDDVPELKKVVEFADDVYTGYALAGFYPEMVNTSVSPLQIRAQVTRQRGEDSHPKLAHWAGTKKLLDPQDMAWIEEELAKSPYVALDIETDTPPESKEWVQKILDASDGRKKNFVDTMGSFLVGMSLTFGENVQHTVYIPVRHASSDIANWRTEDACDVVGLIPEGTPVLIHNTAFELPALYNEWGGWVEGAVDTCIMSSYVNENESSGLKANSKMYFDYDQTTYEEVTTKEGPVGALPPGGEQKKIFTKEIVPAVAAEGAEDPVTWVFRASEQEKLAKALATVREEATEIITPAITEEWESRQYGMSELTAAEVFDYGCDDTICTAALYNRLRFTMELEGCWQTFLDVEQRVTYMAADTFVRGLDIDWERLAQLQADDLGEYNKQWQIVKEYLMKVRWQHKEKLSKAEVRAKLLAIDADVADSDSKVDEYNEAWLTWPGCAYDPFVRTPAGIKKAFTELTGKTLNCRARLEDKIIAAIREQGSPELADALKAGDDSVVDELLLETFKPDPQFSVSKTADLKRLMYDVMKLPVRFRTNPTDKMRERGIKQGNPQADAFAFEHALELDLQEGSPEYKVMTAIKEMKACLTRESLYYGPYPLFRHWQTGKVHPQLGQARTRTRRFAPNAPNINQLPKYKDGGKIRSCILPPPGYIVVAMDFSGQELRLAAEVSQDKNLLSCYVGDNKRNPHALTGAGIAKKRELELGNYDVFTAAKAKGDKEASKIYDTAKKVNFSSQYLCRAPKLGKLITCSVEDAQLFLDAKNATYPELAQWQQDTIVLARQQGYIETMLGARRHLYEALNNVDTWKQGDAERQAVNMVIQGSAGEMTKLAIGSQFDGHFEDENVLFAFPVHDEKVDFVAEAAVCDIIPKLHAYMVQQYADMKVPLESDIKIGWNYGELVSVGSEPTLEAIQAAYEKLLEARNGK